MRRWLTAVAVFGIFIGTCARAQEGPGGQQLQFGLRVGPAEWAAAVKAAQAEPCAPANPVGLTLAIPQSWAQNPDWEVLDSALREAAKDGLRLAVCTEVPGKVDDPAALSYLATLSEHAGGLAATLGLSLGSGQMAAALQRDPDEAALVFKRLISALRGNSKALVLLGEVAPEDLPLMEPLYERDFRAYVEGYSTVATGSTGEFDDSVVRFLEARHLGAPLLVHLPRLETPIAAQLLVLLASSRGATFVDVEPSGVPAVWHGLVVLRSLLTAATGPGMAAQGIAVRDASGPRADVGLIHLLDADRMVQGMLLVPMISGSRPGTLDVNLPTGDVSDPAAYSLPDGGKVEVGYVQDRKKQETTLKVPWQGKALLLQFSRLKTGLVGEEKVSVTQAYRIPVEVIIARHQAVQEAQDQFLRNYRSDAQVDYHFKLPGSTGSLDVTFLNTFFFQRGAGARWVQNQLLVNGVAWKGKTIPQLPIIEPEKVNTLPLALTLGRDYSYRYLRDEVAEGRNCYVVEFIPLPEAKGSLYSGKVWIDKETYNRVKMSVRQTGLQPPQVSNDETDTYEPLKDAGGRTYWVLTRVAGQQIFSVAGANVATERFITFKDFALNDPAFGEEVAKAEASDRRILQDTDKGLRYLKREKDGTRKIEMEPPSGKWFAVGGAYYDPSLSYPIPLAGVNYFDYDWRKTKTQVNLFVAGAVNTLTVSKVDLAPKVDVNADAVLFAFSFDDRYYAPESVPGVERGEEVKPERVKVLREYADAGLGWRFTEFSKLKLTLAAKYYRYGRTSKTDPAFVLPKDHVDLEADLGYRYARRGWTLSADYEAHHRTAWEPWGFMPAGTDVSKAKSYALWSASFSKAFYLPAFQKISTGITWLDGKDLDRFSRYQFSYMGDQSLSGFSGSGVRFDKGAIARLGYQFNVANVIRFGLNVDQARVRPQKDVDLWQNHTGVGLAAAVAGPWQTYWTLDLGYAARSDIRPVQGKGTVALVVLKLW
jgi:hypothetical protein